MKPQRPDQIEQQEWQQAQGAQQALLAQTGQLANNNAPPAFMPSPGPPNENPKAKQERIASELAIYNATPAAKQASKQAENTGSKTGDEVGDTAKMVNVMQSNLPAVLQRFQDMRKAADNASSGLGVTAEGGGPYPAFANSAVGNAIEPGTANANALLQQRAGQGILSELGPQLAQAGVRGNKFLETIANNASGLKMDAPPATKKILIDGLQQMYINNLKSNAAQLRAMNQPAPTDDEIDQMVNQYKASGGITPQASPAAPATSNGWGYVGQVK